MDAAEMLFFSKGYENVSMNDIAQEAEMARGTLYQYFKNKNDIYAAIAIHAAEILAEMFKEVALDQTGIEKIRSLSMTYYQFYKKHTGYYQAYYHSGVFDYHSTPQMEKLKKIRKMNYQFVVKALKEGIADGTIRNDIDPIATTLIMLSMSNNVNNIIPVTQMYMDEYGLTQDELFESNLELVLRSIENGEKHPNNSKDRRII
ncbi:MAG: TetR/AcrR family transcriptional regulator [Methanobacterium sp.]|nr:TetR/AcrR family transcriptional regulator [Methanobacterium sp.]